MMVIRGALPADVTVTAAALGGVPTAEVTVDDALAAYQALLQDGTDPADIAFAGQDPALPLISPVFADLSGLPPLVIQAGSHEVLLDDATRLARQAAAADVAVTLDVPHVFQAYSLIFGEAAAALDRAGRLLSAYLSSSEHVTA